jgi:hypothetical protein
MTTHRSIHRVISSKQLEHKVWSSPVLPHVLLAAIWALEASRVCLSEATQDEAGWPSPRYCIFPQSYHPSGHRKSHLETRRLVSSLARCLLPDSQGLPDCGRSTCDKNTTRGAASRQRQSPTGVSRLRRAVLCRVVPCRRWRVWLAWRSSRSYWALKLVMCPGTWSIGLPWVWVDW